jgi:hypothetical protein
MADIFAEVDEAMRRERVEKFFKENGKMIITFVVMTIIATGVVSAWRKWDASVRQRDTAALIELMDSADFPENINTAELDMRPGLRGIGFLTAASSYLKENKPEEALALYQKASGDSSIPHDLRQLAILMSVRLKTESVAQAQKDLEGIWKDNGSPWRYHARLEAAVLAAHQGNDYSAARTHLAAILDSKEMPESLVGKARALDHVYSLKQQQAQTAAPEKTTLKTDKDS